MPAIETENQGVVFPPMRKHRLIGGVRVSDIKVILITLFLGACLFVFLGSFTQQSQTNLDPNERISYRQELSTMRMLLADYEEASSKANTSDLNALDFTLEEQQMIHEAQSLGVQANMSDADLENLIPQTKEVTVESFPVIPRLILCVFVPFLFVLMAHWEMGHGWSLSSVFKQVNTFRKRQRFYVSRRRHYLWGDSK